MAVTTHRSPLRTHRRPVDEAPVVLPADYQVTDPGGPSSGHRQSALGHGSGSDPVGPGSGVELADGTEVTRDHQAVEAGFCVVLPGQVEGIEHLVPVAIDDPLVGLVGVDGVR